MKPKFKNIFIAIFLVCFCFSPSNLLANDFPVYDGVIEPFVLVDVGSPVDAVVAQVETERSETVKKGQVLVLMESSVEKATVERAKVQVKLMGEILLEQEKLAFAKRFNTRMDELFDENAVSALKKDEAATEVQLAAHRLQKAKESKNLAEMDLKRAQALLNLRIIRSPISGIVLERLVSPGEFVDAEPLLQIAQMDPLRVEVIVPAAMFGRISEGMSAEIQPEMDAQEKYTASVAIVDKVIDAASNTFGVRLHLPNPKYKLPGGLRCSVQFHEKSEVKAEKREGTPESSEEVALSQPNLNDGIPVEVSSQKQESIAPKLKLIQTTKGFRALSQKKQKKQKSEPQITAVPGIYPEASVRILTKEDFDNKSIDELKIIRNEVFARHSYIFDNQQVKKYFEKQPWYTGLHKNVYPLLSQIEKTNLYRIKQQERKLVP